MSVLTLWPLNMLCPHMKKIIKMYDLVTLSLGHAFAFFTLIEVLKINLKTNYLCAIVKYFQ